MINRILSAFALILAIGIFFAYVNPTWNGSIASTKAAIANDNQALLIAKQYASQQNQLATARDSIEPANIQKLNTFLPSSVDNVGLILDLNALASRSGLSISNIDVLMNSDATQGTKSTGGLPSASDNPVSSVDMSISAVGSFNALQVFLIGIEKSARILDVHDISVTGSDTGVYAYKLTLSLYWLR